VCPPRWGCWVRARRQWNVNKYSALVKGQSASVSGTSICIIWTEAGYRLVRVVYLRLAIILRFFDGTGTRYEISTGQQHVIQYKCLGFNENNNNRCTSFNNETHFLTITINIHMSHINKFYLLLLIIILQPNHEPFFYE
jgi:hypothetical protein